MPDEQISPDAELNALEKSLGSLVPARARLDRDRVMFLAGQASAKRGSSSGHKAWMALAASLAVVALTEAAMLVHRPENSQAGSLVVIRDPVKTPLANPAATPSSSNAFRLLKTDHDWQTWQLVLYGLDGLPASPSTARTEVESSPSSRKFLRDEMRKELNLGDPS